MSSRARSRAASHAARSAQKIPPRSARGASEMCRRSPSGSRGGGGALRLRAQVGELDLGVAADLLWNAGGGLPPEVEDVDAVGEVHHDAHVVLDHQDRGALLLVHVEDEAGHVLLLLVVHPGHRLVEEEQGGFERERAGELDALLQPVWEGVHDLLADVLDLEEVDDLLDHLALGDLLALAGAVVDAAGEEAGPLPEVTADEEVVEHRHALEERDVLEGARDAEAGARGGSQPGDVPPLEAHLPLRRPVDAADAIDEARLAGAVRTDDGDELSRADVEADFGKRVHAAEAEGKMLDR